MKIVCVGGGPAGLYFAISAKRRDAGHDITVIECDPPGATYGWGVVYWDDLLDTLYRNDAESARKLRAASALWQEQEIRLHSEQRRAYFRGYGYSMGRATMLDVLGRRAVDLGVDVEYRRRVGDLAEFAEFDLIVAADGANSQVRQLHGHFGTTIDAGANPYIWLGTNKVFDSFVFDFEETLAGWVWCHAYPSSSGISTFIVECQQHTWDALGFGTMSGEDGVRVLEKIFSDVLDGHSLISQSRGEPARWLHFTQVRNQHWYHDNVVLLGDAAHTTHFTLGSGTRVAMIDAIVLADSLYNHEESLATALSDYEGKRERPMRQTQAAGRSSMAWFEHLDRYIDRDAVAFAASMSGRQGPLPPWGYQKHLATQVAPVRKLSRWFDSARRWYLARRRGEPLVYMARRAPSPPLPPAPVLTPGNQKPTEPRTPSPAGPTARLTSTRPQELGHHQVEGGRAAATTSTST